MPAVIRFVGDRLGALEFVTAPRAQMRAARRTHREDDVMSRDSDLTYGDSSAWTPERPRFTLFGLLVSWLATGVALMVAAALLPGVHIDGFWGALLVAAIAAALNGVVPPVLAALRLPLTLVLGFVLVLLADAAILLLTDALTDGILRVDGFGWALARVAGGRGGERRARGPHRLG